MAGSIAAGARWSALRQCLRGSVLVPFAILAAAPASAVQFVEAGSIVAPAGVTQLAYAPAYNVLAIRNSGSAVTTINVATTATGMRLANVAFTDLQLAPDGRHLFVADYGGEGTPAAPSYVHRLDLATMTWEAKSSSIAYHVQPVTDTQVILKSYDQWVSFTNNAWAPGPALQMLSAPTIAPTSATAPGGIVFDGTDVWVTDRANNRLLRLDALGGVLQTVSVGISPREPAFDGANLWVPNAGDSTITVVDARSGALVATIASNPTNRLNAPTSASFDGERIVAFWVGLPGIAKVLRY